MSPLGNGLAKLLLCASKDREGKHPAGALSAMYNPDTLKLEFETRYNTDDALNKGSITNSYICSEPAGVSLELVFDARMPANTTPIENQLAMLQSMCTLNSATGETSYLKISWGKMRWGNKKYFAGRASSLSITYSLFDRDATPLRATANISLVADESLAIQHAEENKLAPQRAIVSISDRVTLPLLALQVASVLNSPRSYLDLAWENDLDNLDQLICGNFVQASRKG